MRKSALIGIAATIVLAAGMTTWARQRDAPPAVEASPIVTDDFIEVGDRLIFRRNRIGYVGFLTDGQAEVFLIGRQRPASLTPEEAKELRAALTSPGGTSAPLQVPPDELIIDPELLRRLQPKPRQPEPDEPSPQCDLPLKRRLLTDSD